VTIDRRASSLHAGGAGEGFEVCELAWSVAAGESAAIPPLLRELHPAVSAYCRARARVAGKSFGEADHLALEVCRSILAGLSAPTGADRPFLRLAYSFVLDAADRGFGARGDVPITRVQQDILILRTIVGLDPEQTAVAMALSPRRIRTEQHAALLSLRAA